MRIILIEYIWQATEIIKKNNFYKNDVIVSLDPESSYALKSRKIKFFESFQFCIHKHLRVQYKEITERTFKITKALDESLFYSDHRYKKLKWRLFDDYHYAVKICFDQLFYFAELISLLIEIYNPEEILVADSKKIVFNEQFLLSSNSSVLKFILKTLNNTKKTIKISYMNLNENISREDKHNFSFGPSKHFFLPNEFTRKIKEIIYKVNFFKEYFFSKSQYLSIGCFEIEKLKKLYPNETKNILSYFHEDLNKNCAKKNTNFSEKFNNYLLNNTDYIQLIRHKNLSFQFIFEELIKNLLLFLDFYINQYKQAKKIVKNKSPECVIFQSMSPFYSPNVIFRKICKDLHVPYLNWVHGGYFTYSFPGYDVVDYRFCNNHISYGDYLSDLIKDEKCILNNFYLDKKQNIFSVGSARFDSENKDIIQENKKIKNDKPTILFMAGMRIPRNQFYFGYNREKAESSLWEFQYEILCILKEYQDKYNIIFKDYPDGFPNMWKKILNDIGAEKILYISKKKSINDLLKISDLNILPWMSTTFFETLYFNADIFLVDEDIYEKPFIEKLSKEIYCFKNIEKFKLKLKNYLDEGKFYRTTKNFSRKYFLNLDNSKNRFEFFNNALTTVKNEKKNYL